MLASYRPLFEVPGARVFITGGMIARSAGSMFGVSVVAMVAARTGSYALAGAVVAVGMVSLALFAPFLGRLVDRYGQRRIAIPFFLWSGFWAVMTVLTSLRGWPSWLLFITFPLCGAIPNLGTMARARWSYIFAHDPRSLHTAMSFEQVMEEITFVIGPVLAIWLSTTLFPEAGFVFATVAYGVGVLIFISARSTEPPVVPHHERPAEHAYTVPGLIPLAFIMVMTGAIFGVNEVVTLAVSGEAGAKGAAGAILALYAVGSALAGLVFGHFSHGRNLLKLLIVGTLGMAVLESPLVLAGNLWVLAGIMLVAGMATAPTLITTMNLIERIVPRAQLNEGMTIVLTGLIVGIAAGSAVSGAVVDRVGASQGYWVAVFAGVLAFVMAVGTRAFLQRRDLANIR
ncbi:MFS transporter [Intrasporangium oryzae NRRL B-24470]|uniref:MFS transporter n=1 Tax=Intrasporangium oryzae NRRL B-24470 TaxID=1386089 RepID=W9G5F4_9MICO|nr:MFS transporter [Intrasporangium oryzae]EWT01401.1 MFS transporter [Intrasporangium oryzae NRRL B-24470]